MTLRSALPRALAITLLIALIPLATAVPASAAKVKTIRIADASIVEGNNGQQNLAFRLTWTGSKGGPAPSVQYATADGSAAAGSDYTATSGTATLSNGACRCTTVNVPIAGDTTTEGTETFVVDLHNAVNGTIGDAQATGTIYDNEGPPSLVVTDVPADEGDGPLAFEVILTNASASTVTVDHAVTDGTATAGEDYTASSGSLTFTAGQTTKTVNVTIDDDGLAEDDETVLLGLSGAVNASISDAQGIGVILNDDPDPVATIADVAVDEADGIATVTVTLDTASGRETAVDYATSDGSAAVSDDYGLTTGSLVIPAGTTSATVDIPIVDDDTDEGDETFGVTLTGEVDLTLGDAVATVTIADDDPTPTLGVGAVSAGESAGTATVTFSLSNPSSSDVSFDWATSDGTAGAGDYTAAGGSVTIPAGDSSGSGNITLLTDTIDEANETVTITLSNLVGAIDGGPGTLTILDDDASPTALTAKVTKTTTAVKVKGRLEPATGGLTVKVLIQRKKGARYVTVTSKVVVLKGLKDRDADGKTDGVYVAAFANPGRGSYRAKVTFLGTADLLASSKTVRFRI